MSTKPLFDPTEFQSERDERLIATKADAILSTTDASIIATNALSPELLHGEREQVFGRRGRIPGSINIPADDLIAAETRCFRRRQPGAMEFRTIS